MSGWKFNFITEHIYKSGLESLSDFNYHKQVLPQLNCHKDLRYSDQFLVIVLEGLNGCLWKNQRRKKWDKNSMSKLQEHKLTHFEKLWENLWLLRWLRASLNLVGSFSLFGLWILKINFGRPIFIKVFLKYKIDSVLRC